MAEGTRTAFDQLIHQPHGIMLVTGPTGSGKTTTLYGAIRRLDHSTTNIMTVEDPIEYYIDGIGQTQVNTRVEMTFARGLRAILRQDPDVVMVGEIRDLETAQIAVQASLTGHLVLSTLHTNTATGAVTRLRDMGIECDYTGDTEDDEQ
jgi:general secretion pathway protein E